MMATNLVCVLLVVLYWKELLGWLKAEEDGLFPLVFIAVVLLAALPGVPFGLVGGIIGAKYGLINGGIINLAASISASAIVYVLVKYLFSNWAAKWLQKSPHLRRLDDFLHRHVFWSILLARLIPIMPAALINVYAGIFGLSFIAFLAATLLGKIPFIVVFTFVGDNVHSGAQQWPLLLTVYGVFLAVVVLVYRLVMKRRVN
jgi:uncharacterized membrane protein YdjX (TVP38/TMEM64 family)